MRTLMISALAAAMTVGAGATAFALPSAAVRADAASPAQTLTVDKIQYRDWRDRDHDRDWRDRHDRGHHYGYRYGYRGYYVAPSYRYGCRYPHRWYDRWGRAHWRCD